MSSPPIPPTFIFAGGGTGGHLYPGLAIAEQLRAMIPGVKVLFLSSNRDIDRKVLEPEGVPWEVLPAQPVSVRPRKLWKFISNWPASVRATRAAIKQARQSGGEVRLVALGGFVAAPAVQAARAERVPVTLINLDATPGKANKWIASRCGEGAAFTTYPSPAHPSWKVVSPIVRSAAFAPGDKAHCRRELGLDPAKPVLMVTGGSLGASTINKLMLDLTEQHTEAFKGAGGQGGWQVLHQCGKEEEVAALVAGYAKSGIRAVIVAYCRQMGLWWGASDLTISRAGAGGVAEAWCNRVPCVFLPYPYHNDDHQRLNAQILTDRGACVVCTDHVEPGPNLADAGKTIADLLRDPQALQRLTAGTAALPPADGARVIAGFLARNPA
jgi:UDP-N-acetylglucosamine--N-acetylmuramyl-(pentapeptide) pyrophosphoryl-undecaprenol N-acetylglucosamine transferase